ncbi:hypothetical protein M9978_16530 [Sphingomonas sp. MG17]|uniref:Uncharacterized protein n=1 Tax=Sphingomonas tagetis TaxID=2949092 RepID=A0A9X2HR80_9SPHN|nr:hypothetical protein [Sphingomonas tagetis]MCP3732033.1 hypothetical protein [Sphingomonas tagetis]
MAYTADDLVAIRAAIKSGIRKVTFADGRSTEYQSLDQLLKAEEVIAAQVAMLNVSASSIRRRRVPYYRSGVR